MTKSDLSYYVWIRGCFQFGLISVAVFILLVVIGNWPNVSAVSNYNFILIAAPIFGLALGALMYYWDKKRGKLPPPAR